jgi:hypothetical protein
LPDPFSSIGVCSMMQSPPMTLEPAPEGRDPNPGPGPGDDYSGSDYRSGRITNLAVGVCAREPMPLPPTPRAPSIKSHAEPNQGPSCPRSGTMTVPCNKGGALLRKAPTRASLANGSPPARAHGFGHFSGRWRGRAARCSLCLCSACLLSRHLE